MDTDTRTKILAEFIEAYRRTGQLIVKSVHSSLHDEPDFNHAYLMVLGVLRQKGTLSQHAIAEELCHSDAAVSRQISALIEKKYIEIKSDPSNRRVSNITLTHLGREVLEAIESKVFAHMAHVLMSVSDDDLRTMTDINNQITAAIKAK